MLPLWNSLPAHVANSGTFAEWPLLRTRITKFFSNKTPLLVMIQNREKKSSRCLRLLEGTMNFRE